MKRTIKIFFVYVLIITYAFEVFGKCAWNVGVDKQQLLLEKRYQQVRLEYQSTIIYMLILLESNKHLILQILESQTDIFAQEITLQALRETEWKINALKKKLTAS